MGLFCLKTNKVNSLPPAPLKKYTFTPYYIFKLFIAFNYNLYRNQLIHTVNQTVVAQSSEGRKSSHELRVFLKGRVIAVMKKNY